MWNSVYPILVTWMDSHLKHELKTLFYPLDISPIWSLQAAWQARLIGGVGGEMRKIASNWGRGREGEKEGMQSFNDTSYPCNTVELTVEITVETVVRRWTKEGRDEPVRFALWLPLNMEMGGEEIKDFVPALRPAEGEGVVKGCPGVSRSLIWAKGQQHQPFSLPGCLE